MHRRSSSLFLRLFSERFTACAEPFFTHDLNLAPDADRIFVVDQGRIVETGRHEELLARAGRTPVCTTRRPTR
ncbi:hypothetical protein [Streptomyces sp. NPDC047009]|uniref:hypothetical protein n=1 Tax=Streptomyces sp. NPDC047009 TaxID=3154496 RepID=UPI0033E12100